MQCPRCQAENRDGARFCRACGATFFAVCSSCGAKVEAGGEFCDGCGAPLAASVPGAISPRFASPESYTPKHLAERILTSKTALEGERKQVTVLFADLKGSMELLADRDPEEARKLLDPVLERMMEAVHRFEGTVNQVMGDGIMALFGAPLAHEDHAVRACYAALWMQESVNRYAEGVFRSHGVLVQIRVGLNSGEVVVRAIGSDLHMDYTAVGQTTHLAARMEQLAAPGTVLLAPAALQLAEGYVEVTSRGSVAIKGLLARVEVFELTGASAVRSRLQAAAARGFTRFVGRDAEMEQLRRALEQARSGHGQLVGVVGEPGQGKSRLFYEFTHSHRTQDWRILESGSVSYGKATSYLPVIDLLKAYFKITDRDSQQDIQAKVTEAVLTLDRALEPTVAPVLALLDVPTEHASWTNLDPQQRRQRTLDAVKRLLLREAQVQPLLVVFEDLHWIDTETQAFLDSLVESLPTARILLLVNYRPEYRQAWASKTYYTQLRIDPLPLESADQLLATLLGEDPLLHGFRQFLIQRTEGNPFFLEESVRELVETHVLVGARGAYRLAAPLAEIQVPATVHAVLAARIDRLPPDEKRLLQTAAIVGKDVPLMLLEAVAELPRETLRQSIIHLQAAEFLYEARLFPDLEYTFKHALTHDVAYASPLRERRRVVHARIVKAIERVYADRLFEHVERLGHHALRGELWPDALRYLRQAGAKAYARSANLEAVAWYEQALGTMEHLTEDRDTLEQAIDLRFDLRHALLPLGEPERVLGYLREASIYAVRLHDHRRLGWLSAYQSVHSWFAGDNDGAVESGHRALAIANKFDDFALRVAANFYLGCAYHGRGDYRLAKEFLLANAVALPGELARENFGLAGPAAVFSGIFLALCLSELGQFSDAIRRTEEILPLAEMINQQYSLAWTYLNGGVVYLRSGDLDKASAALERGLAISPPFTSPSLACFLGYAKALQGRVSDALPLLTQAVEQAEAMKLTMMQSVRLAHLAEAQLLVGRFDGAVQSGSRALDLARAQHEGGSEAHALRVLGEIYAAAEPLDAEKSAGHYRQAVALANDLGMRPLVAHCHLGLGKLYRRTGQCEQAHEHLTTATTLYREMDMRFWLEQAEAERKECR